MIKLLSTLLISLISLNTILAQTLNSQDISISKVNSMAIGTFASTNGIGANIIYSLSENITVKAGFEKLNFNYDFSFNENDINYKSNLNYQTGSFSVLIDYSFLRNLYVSSGIGFNMLNPKVKGVADSDLIYGDISIPAEKIGNFDISIEPSMKISPYGGLGFGQSIGQQKRMAFYFELGAYYMGTPDVTINATGLLSPTANPAHGQKAVFEKQLESYRFYPVVKFGLSVKIF